jgi:hypothetical protein
MGVTKNCHSHANGNPKVILMKVGIQELLTVSSLKKVHFNKYKVLSKKIIKETANG